MIVTVFRARLRPDAGDDYLPMLERMVELSKTMPGYVSQKRFVADDGERLTLVEFESREAQEAWRRHAEHAAAQRQGRQSFYSEYSVTVCEVLRQSRFPAESPAGELPTALTAAG
jgi:heme-degrading monooxygenase HmoA